MHIFGFYTTAIKLCLRKMHEYMHKNYSIGLKITEKNVKNINICNLYQIKFKLQKYVSY